MPGTSNIQAATVGSRFKSCSHRSSGLQSLGGWSFLSFILMCEYGLNPGRMYMGKGYPWFQIENSSLIASVALFDRSICSFSRGYVVETNSSNHRSRISLEAFALKKTKKSLLVAYKPNKSEMRHSNL